MSVISRLVIDQQYAAIGVRSTPAQLSISTPRPQMQIIQERPEMMIDRKIPEFKLNWKKVYSESGLKRPHDLTLSIRDSARGKVVDYIIEEVKEGDYLAKVEQPGNRVAQLARNKELQTSQKELNLDTIPKSVPEVMWDPGFIKINWSDHKFQIEWAGDYMPEVIVDPPYSIEIYLRNKPYIKISVEEGDFYSFGRYVDAKL